MKKSRLLVFIVMACPWLAFGQTVGDYQSNLSFGATGSWSTLATWQRWNGAAWAVPTALEGYPGQFNTPTNVSTGGFFTTINFDVSPPFALNNLTIGGLLSTVTTAAFNPNLTINGALSLSNTNAFSFGGTGNLTVLGGSSFAGTFTDSNDTGTTTFTGQVTVSNSMNTTSVTTSSHLIFRGGISNTGTVTAGGATFDTNNQSISGSGTISFSQNVVITGITLSSLNAGNLTVSGTTTGTGSFTNNNNTGVDTFVGNVNLSGAFTSTVAASTSLVFRGGITSNGTSFSAGGATFDTNNQAITGSTAVSFANNVVITGITLTFSNTNNLTITGTTSGTGSFTDNSNSGIDTFVGNVSITGNFNTTAVTSSSNLVFRGGIANSMTSFTGGGATFDTNGQAISGTTATSFANNVAITGITLTYSNTNNLTISGTTTGTGSFTDSSNNGIDIFAGNVNLGGTFDTSVVTTSANVVFRGGITSSGTSFVAGGATFNTSGPQSISGTTALSFANNVIVTGVTVTNDNTGGITMSATAGAVLSGTGTWTQGTTTNTLNYAGTTIAISTFNASGINNTVNYNSAAGGQTIYSTTYHHLTLSGGGSQTKTLAAATVVNGNLSIQNNSVFSVSTFGLQVKGDWLNSSSNADPFTQGAQTVTFNGTAAQNITNTGNANGTVFNNVTLNNSAGFTLNSGNTVVQGTLTFTAGAGSKVNLNSLTLTIGTSAASPGTLVHTQASTDGWAYNGSLTRFVSAATIADLAVTGFFPLGNATNFRPFYISSPATAIATGGSFTVTHSLATNTIILPPAGTGIADASPPAKNILLQHQASWSVSSSGVVGGAGTPFNIIAGGTGFGVVALLSDLRLCKSASVVGTYVLATGTIADPRLKRTGLTLANITTTGGSQWFVGSTDAVNTPLPVTLVNFSAELSSAKVLLKWKTESELNNDAFTVQRTSDGETFVDIQTIKGAGTTTIPRSYSAMDESSGAGRRYYRLKQTDYDGNFSYSKLVMVDVPEFASSSWIAFPNPTSGASFSVRFNDSDVGKEVFMKLQDMNGKEILEDHKESLESIQAHIVPSQALAPGIYVLSIAIENQVSRIRIVVK